MGSGGLIVMDDRHLHGRTPRGSSWTSSATNPAASAALPLGTTRMLEILERITRGEGREGDVELLDELCAPSRTPRCAASARPRPIPCCRRSSYFRDEYEEHIIDKHCDAGVCADMQLSPCSNACPADVKVPGYMTLLAAGRIGDAYRLIRQDNPFPSVCGRVCTHPCESRCRRAQVDEALAICDLKRFIADYTFDRIGELPLITPLPPTGKKVAVIGAGPAGLSCAYFLANMGHEVDVYEEESVAGGLLYWGIPEYRLPKKVLAREIEAIERAGVKIHLNTAVGKDVSFEEIDDASDAVYIATGAIRSRSLGVPGEKLEGVESGLVFLKRVALRHDYTVRDRLVVVGGGNTAIDVARTAVRCGAKEVTILYRRTEKEMPADVKEIKGARDEGVKVVTLASPVEILGEDGKVTA
jgi:NADH-quinone oxidoreductase subunit F